MIRRTLEGVWTLYEYNCADRRYPVTVPGSVLSALLDAGVIPGCHFRHGQAVHADFQRAHSLEDSAFKVAVNAHDLASGLHLRAAHP